MKRTFTKILTLVLALVLCFSLCGAAFANEEVVIEVEEVVAPKEEVVVPKEEVVAPKEEVVAPKEEVVVPKEEVVVPKEEIVEDPKEEIVEDPKEEIVEDPKEEIVEDPKEGIEEEPKEEIVKESKKEETLALTLTKTLKADPAPEEVECLVCHAKFPKGSNCPNADKENHKNWNWMWYPTDPCNGVEILNKDLAAFGGNTMTFTVRPTQTAYYATGVIVTDLTTGEQYNLPIEPNITGWGTVNFKVPNDPTGAQHVYSVQPVQGFSPYTAYVYGTYNLGYGCYPTSYTGRVPKTGDDANLGLWAVLMTMSAASLAGVYFCTKKNKG